MGVIIASNVHDSCVWLSMAHCFGQMVHPHLRIACLAHIEDSLGLKLLLDYPAGLIPQAVSSASTAISMAVTPQMGTDPRISIQPFGTPGQRNFVGSYGSQHFANPSNRAWSPL